MQIGGSPKSCVSQALHIALEGFVKFLLIIFTESTVFL